MIFGKILYIPLIDFIVREFSCAPALATTYRITANVLNGISLVLYIAIMIYIERLFKLNMPSEYALWSGPNNQVMYFGFIAKVVNPIIIGMNLDDKYIFFEVIISLIAQVVYLLSILLFAHTYSWRVGLVQKIS